MTNIEKQSLLGLFNKPELTMYDLQRIIEFFFNAFKTSKEQEGGVNAMFSPLSEQLTADIYGATNIVSGLGTKLVNLMQQSADLQDAAYEDMEARYQKLYEKHSALTKRIQLQISQTEKIKFPDINLPYNWKEVLELSDRLSSMPKEKREVFYELLKTFTKN